MAPVGCPETSVRNCLMTQKSAVLHFADEAWNHASVREFIQQPISTWTVFLQLSQRHMMPRVTCTTYSQRRGTARTLPEVIVLFCVLFVCKCVLYCYCTVLYCTVTVTVTVLYCCHRLSAELQLTNIGYL